MKKQSEGGGDGDEEGTGTLEDNAPKKRNKKKPLSEEEKDQLYAMTTAEQAGYDVIFMQVLGTLSC